MTLMVQHTAGGSLGDDDRADYLLDLLSGQSTELTRLRLVRRRPLPFPPEPFAWLGIRLTTAALVRADRNGGRRGPWLRLLDALGVGFDS